ncbi:MAG: glycosyltransferase family A protein [Syntrophobacterales bacterium]|jgi:glycosyltransferase involved in cell wall biosynthesis
MSPEISVIIPTYNRAAMVVEAVESVLAQDTEGFELIVVDDGSTDDTEKRLAVFGSSLRYQRQENAGVSRARNLGVELSRAPMVAFLDSDDLWLSSKLRIQHGYMVKHPDVLICQTEEIWWRNGRRVNPKKHHKKQSGDIFKPSLELCLVSPSAVMMRRELFERVGYFDEDLPMAEDYDLWLRVAVEHPVPLISEPLVIKRGGHQDQLSKLPAIDRYRIKALEKLLNSGNLSPEQYEWTWQALKDKCQIYGQGCLKRGKVEEGEHYLALAEKYRRKAQGQRRKVNS